MRVRLDWVAQEVGETVNPAELGSPHVFHYSIPNFDAFGDGALEEAESIESAKTRVRGDEVLISKLNPRKLRVVNTRPHEVPSVCSGEFVVLRPNAIEPRFLRYLLLSEETRQLLDSRVQSVTRSHQRARPEDVLKLWIDDLPDLVMQSRIADYLDNETARIDALIAAKRRMASLLKDKLLAHCENLLVTDEVVRWVPLHHLTDPRRPVVYGIVQAGDEFPGGVPYIKTGDLPELDPSKLSHTSPDIDEAYRRARVVPGDIVVAMRASIGSAVQVPPTLPTANLTQGTARIAARQGVDARWLLHAFRTRAVQEQCSTRAVGTTYMTLNIWDLRRIWIPTPELSRCKLLARQADLLVRNNDEVSVTLDRQVVLLAERRQALITAAVTGQLDIREAA